MSTRISVVVSQGQSQNPLKRQLEEDIVTALMLEPAIDVTVVPHLYDLSPDSTGMLALTGVSGDLIVLSWLYERAARWILDRNQIQGQSGITLLATETDDDEEELDEELDEEATEQESDKQRVMDRRELPNRRIYCIELAAAQEASDFLEEIRRIAAENSQQVVGLSGWVNGKPNADSLARYERPTNDTAIGPQLDAQSSGNGSIQRIEEAPGRRWYPVIDFSRCTNCMECIDFCLFGVYGVDAAETILVEQPDNCRKGCPACSRVCPENAIIFPQHKTPAIAGAPVIDGGSFKIDLSKLFGAPDAVEIAAAERDEQLVMAGRDAVGLTVGIPKRQADKPAEPRDNLDDLIDTLDDLDL